MSKFNRTISELKRATATVLLSAGVAVAYIAVMTGGELNPSAQASTWAESSAIQQDVPDRPAGARRWRSSNAEQSLATLTYFGEPDPWGRNRAALEGAMTLSQLGDIFSSKEPAGARDGMLTDLAKQIRGQSHRRTTHAADREQRDRGTGEQHQGADA